MLVDDNTDELGPLAAQISLTGRGVAKVYSPQDVDLASLEAADLVVVDFTLDSWLNTLDTSQIAVTPINGVALASVLREHAQSQKYFPPTGFALITGRPGTLGLLPDERRPHVLSRLSNVEWFFEKADSKLAVRILSLAKAIHDLPESVSEGFGSLDALLEVLRAGSDLRDRYRAAVQRCRPPIHHLAERSHGLVVIRWLLHRILPHTAFLLDDFHLAARLGITPSSVQALSAPGSCVSPYLYSGPLADFDGPRWWRDGIEQFLWDLTKGNSADPDEIVGALSQLGWSGLDKTAVVRPVATIDQNLRREPDFSSRDHVIPLFLDDWPSYAEPAFGRAEVIQQHREMQMYVLDESTG